MTYTVDRVAQLENALTRNRFASVASLRSSGVTARQHNIGVKKTAPAKKSTAKKTVSAKPAAKTATKKSVAKKSVAKKSVAKKSSAKKTTTKKS